MTFNASGNNVPIDTSSVMPCTGIGMRKFLAISCAMIAGYSSAFLVRARLSV